MKRSNFINNFLFLLLALPSVAYAQMGMMGGGYGFDPNLPIVDSEDTINSYVMMLSNFSMTHSGFSGQEQAPDPSKNLQNYISLYGLDKSENRAVADKVLDRLAMRLAIRSSAKTYDYQQKSFIERTGPSKDLEYLSQALTDMNLPLPSQYGKMVELQNIRKENPDNKAYFEKIKSIATPGSDEYKAVLTESYYSDFSNFSFENAKQYIEEMAQTGIDQNFLGTLFSSSIMATSSAYGFLTPVKPEDAEKLLKLLTKYIDFNANISPFNDNILCSQVLPTANFIKIMEQYENGYQSSYGDYNSYYSGRSEKDQVQNDQEQYNNEYSEFQNTDYGGTEVTETNQEQHYTVYTPQAYDPKQAVAPMKANIKKMLEYGGDINVRCSDGRRVKDIIEDMKKDGYLEADFLFETMVSDKKKEECETLLMVDFNSLCDVAATIAKLSNVLNKNERTLEEYNMTNNGFIDGISDDKCDLTVLDKHVKNAEGLVTREIELKVTTKTGAKKNFTLSSKDKEAFLNELRSIDKK